MAAGLLWTAAFPKIGVAGLAWIAPGLMLAAAAGAGGRQAFHLGYVAGLVHHLSSLYWLLHIPVMKLAPVTGWLALSAYLSLYPAVWIWLCWRLHPPAAPGTEEAGGRAFWSELPDRLLAPAWWRRAVWTLACAALWVALEMVRARLLSGFPWNPLGASQYRMTPLIQVAQWTGVYGVSFMAVWFSVSLLNGAAVVLRRTDNPRRWVGEIILPLAAVLGLAAAGVRMTARPVEPSGSLAIALVQPSIPQRWIWDSAESSNRFRQLLQLSERALAEKPDLLVWPEAATPNFIRWDTNLFAAVTNLVRRHGVWLVLGSDDAAPAARPRPRREHDVFNASFLINPTGEIVAGYRKRQLVMFGEYLPFHRWLPFLSRWTGMGSFTPGRVPALFSMPDLGRAASVLICFEDVFPHLAREHAGPEVDFLLNLTNDGWFGESAAQWQHAACAVFRAVENGLPLVRCTNNGLTCWVDARGGLHDEYLPGTRDAYGAGFKVVQVPLPPKGARPPTLYQRRGDWFGWSCAAWSGLLVARTLAERRRLTPP